jgi:hypothetical protein
MIALLTLSLAQAADLGPLPDASLAELGLGAATRIEGAADLRRYPLIDRGVVTVVVFADAAAADVGFDGLHRTGATHWPPTVAPAFAVDRSAGDGAAITLVRVGNAVVMVRDSAGQAGSVAQAVLAAMR